MLFRSYTGERIAESDDLEITKVLINAPLSRTIKHYQKIKETVADDPEKGLAGKGPAQIYADVKKEPEKPQDMLLVTTLFGGVGRRDWRIVWTGDITADERGR